MLATNTQMWPHRYCNEQNSLCAQTMHGFAIVLHLFFSLSYEANDLIVDLFPSTGETELRQEQYLIIYFWHNDAKTVRFLFRFYFLQWVNRRLDLINMYERFLPSRWFYARLILFCRLISKLYYLSRHDHDSCYYAAQVAHMCACMLFFTSLVPFCAETRVI